MLNRLYPLAFFPLLLLFLAPAVNLKAQQSETQLNYINRFKDIAVQEMERTGIPASIKLAQGLLESNAGQSVLARRANNHFGIKCGSDWQGDSFYREDDDYDANGQLIKSCFRSYKNSDASFIAHSEFLRDPRKAFRYGFLFRLDPMDYRNWAYGLKQAGYATNPAYPESLISLIERYQLFLYDNATAVDIDTPSDIVASGILDNNDVRYVVVTKGESLEDIAKRVDVSVRNLISYNEKITSSQQEIAEGERVYLQPKRNGYRGKEKYHTVATGETMFNISQEYAVKLSNLYKRNRMSQGEEPRVNEKIKLRGCKVKDAPKLRSEEDEFLNPGSSAPLLPNGELDMEEPDEDTSQPSTPTRPVTPPPVIVQPEAPNNGGNRPDVPIIIVDPNRPPAPAPQPTKPTTTQPPVVSPTPTNPSPAPTTNPTNNPNGNPVYHTVVAGETLYGISRRYNITVDQLKSLNGLTENTIQAGMQLRVK